jgi:hypothetical protein
MDQSIRSQHDIPHLIRFVIIRRAVPLAPMPPVLRIPIAAPAATTNFIPASGAKCGEAFVPGSATSQERDARTWKRRGALCRPRT